MFECNSYLETVRARIDSLKSTAEGLARERARQERLFVILIAYYEQLWAKVDVAGRTVASIETEEVAPNDAGACPWLGSAGILTVDDYSFHIRRKLTNGSLKATRPLRPRSVSR